MNNQNKSFFDSKTILSILLVLVVFYGWQTYLNHKYPHLKNPKVETVATGGANVEQASPAPEVKANSELSTSPAAAVATKETVAGGPETLLPFENEEVRFEVSSQGMGLRGVTLKKHFDRQKNAIQLGSASRGLFDLRELSTNQPISFSITKKSDNIFEGVAQVGDTRVIRLLEIDLETLALKNSVKVENVGAGFHGLRLTLTEAHKELAGGSFLVPSLEHQEVIVIHSDTEERVIHTGASEKVTKDFSNVTLAGIGSQYFASTVVDKSQIIPEVRLEAGKGQDEILLEMTYKNPAGQSAYQIDWIGYTGEKSLTHLEKIDKSLARIVNYGFFGQIGRILLVVMKWFYGIFGNWGMAIIFLTLLVRVLVLPLNISTFRSTKKMQQIQPLIAGLRERYKDDPQALNREMMGLWKEHKVNPLGGCLPMLLQLPIFFALYQVLGQSIELYQAPFFGWIQDLSLKDPYYVLPVLMGVCMYIQQKITPTTMDPAQAKVMQFLPIVFAFMMISLPAGLTLYIFINTLSGIILQQVFMGDKSLFMTKTAKA